MTLDDPEPCSLVTQELVGSSSELLVSFVLNNSRVLVVPPCPCLELMEDFDIIFIMVEDRVCGKVLQLQLRSPLALPCRLGALGLNGPSGAALFQSQANVISVVCAVSSLVTPGSGLRIKLQVHGTAVLQHLC